MSQSRPSPSVSAYSNSEASPAARPCDSCTWTAERGLGRRGWANGVNFVWVEAVMTDEVRGGQAGRVSLLCPYCVKVQTATRVQNDVEARLSN